MSNEELETRSGNEHPDREQSNRERRERELRDREELGRAPAEARERALADEVTQRRERNAREEVERVEDAASADDNEQP